MPAVKAVAPDVTVVSAGLRQLGARSPTKWGRAMDDQVYVQRMLDAMRVEFAAQYPCFDAFGYHAEGFPYRPKPPQPTCRLTTMAIYSTFAPSNTIAP